LVAPQPIARARPDTPRPCGFFPPSGFVDPLHVHDRPDTAPPVVARSRLGPKLRHDWEGSV